MWQPNRAQWLVIYLMAALLVFAWPPDRGASLGVKAMHWLVDPRNELPPLPPPLPPGLGDDGDAVAAHDAAEAEYYRLYNGSEWTRRRIDIKASGDPFEPTTARQLLVATTIVAALIAWRLAPRKTPKNADLVGRL